MIDFIFEHKPTQSHLKIQLLQRPPQIKTCNKANVKFFFFQKKVKNSLKENK